MPGFQSTRPRGARRMFHVPVIKHGEFQSTRPRGARPPSLRPAHYTFYFNPRARVGRDGIHLLAFPTYTYFNPRARVGRDMRRHLLRGLSIHFNPRARVGRDREPCRLASLRLDFNPRARVGRDGKFSAVGGGSGISIHAPAWGATYHFIMDFPRISISIHAPAWGATDVERHLLRFRRFQSTRPRGARQGAQGGDGAVIKFQSTRPRGARPHGWQRWDMASIFQSTRPRGARRYISPSQTQRSHFNPRARVGRDRMTTSGSPRTGHFNPRARVGRDVRLHKFAELDAISIHAPAWGATILHQSAAIRAQISIHAPAWGATASRLMFWPSAPFQSTRPRGARRHAAADTPP